MDELMKEFDMKSITQRIAEAVAIDANGCWLWQRMVDRDGYGLIKIGGRNGAPRAAHRISYTEHVGPIEPGLQIDHLCRVRNCVNPEHLEPVTGQVNTMRSPLAPASINARKTRCKMGHEFSGSNLHISPAGYRVCRACSKAKGARWRAANQPTP